MTIYAHVENGAVIELRNIPDADWPTYPAELKPFMRLCVWEGDGPLETTIIEPDRVRKVRSHPPLDEIKTELHGRLDMDAETIRLKYITPGAGMALTYSEKFAQAQGVTAMGEQAANALTEAERMAQFPTLAASVGLEAATLYDCAQLVLTKYAQFAQLSMVIERTRLAGKKAISDAQSADAARAAYEAVTWTV